jgi:hypothetical protein
MDYKEELEFRLGCLYYGLAIPVLIILGLILDNRLFIIPFHME